MTDRREHPDRRAVSRDPERRGRKKRFDGPPVSVRLPAALHDVLSLDAIRRDIDLSDVIREGLIYFVSRKTQNSTALA